MQIHAIFPRAEVLLNRFHERLERISRAIGVLFLKTNVDKIRQLSLHSRQNLVRTDNMGFDNLDCVKFTTKKTRGKYLLMNVGLDVGTLVVSNFDVAEMQACDQRLY